MQRIDVHPLQPQRRLLDRAASCLGAGELAVVPTDAGYALACRLADKAAADRLRAIRQIDERHLLTLLCRDLSEVSHYAQLDNQKYRFLKQWTPGPYTFVLPATREVPRRLAHPSRKTVGMRVPDSPALRGLLDALGEPLLASSLRLPNDTQALGDPDEIIERLGKRIDLLLSTGVLGTVPSTIVDLTGQHPLLRRAGLGFEAIVGSVPITAD
jgi:tRNA threonylcarbamoyl adenosine modification protein (Sua5/YciO/YrdC/YwlC family)